MIDHAWGYEPCTIADIKVYKPEAKSIGSGQVLSSAYSSEKAKVVVLEMAEQFAFDLFYTSCCFIIMSALFLGIRTRKRRDRSEITDITANPI